MSDVTISMIDGQTRPTSKTFEHTSDVIADMVADAPGFITQLLAVSGVGTSEFSIQHTEQAVNASEGPTANKDEAVRLRLQMTDGSIYNLRIPAPKKTAGVYNYVSNGVVNTAHAALQTFLGNFVAAGSWRLNGKTLGPLPGSLLSGYLEE